MEIKDIVKVVEDAQALANEHTLQAIVNALRAADLDAVCWYQYTPSFNDGAPCEFTMESPCVFLISPNFDDEYSTEEYMEFGVGKNDSDEVIVQVCEYTGLESLKKELDEFGVKIDNLEEKYTSAKELIKNLNSLEGSMEYIFGNHTSITITKEGKVIQDEYDCGY